VLLVAVLFLRAEEGGFFASVCKLASARVEAYCETSS